MKIWQVLIMAVVGADAFLFSRKSRMPLKQDCRWMPWRNGSCVRSSDGSLRREEIRTKLKEQNGGRRCQPGESKRISSKTCSLTEYTTKSILKMIGASREESLAPAMDGASGFAINSGLPSRVLLANFERQCNQTFTDSAGGIQLFGAGCNSANKRTRYARAKRQTPPFHGNFLSLNHRDILFLVDESGSVGLENFKKELRLVKVLADKFCYQRRISPTQTRVALTTFGTRHTHHLDFDAHMSAERFISAVDKVKHKYKGSSTCAVGALEGVLEQFVTAKGSRVELEGGSKSDGLVIMITDGCFNCFPSNGLATKLQELQNSFNDRGIFLMSFMINVHDHCKENFRHLFDGSVCFQGVSYDSWEAFENTVDDVANTNNWQECINVWDTNHNNKCP